MSEEKFKQLKSEPIPIIRAFQASDGKKYVYGYGAIFTTPDSHGTVMTREVVEYSIKNRLKKFPTSRFMHSIPFGTIVFDREIEGVKTFVNDRGFHVLIEVYPEAEKQFNMIQNGHWGLSWSMAALDAKTQIRVAADGKLYPHFVKGTICEISVVDSPSHPDCEAYIIQRLYGSSDPPTDKKITIRGFEAFEVNADGSLSIPEPQTEEKAEIPPYLITRNCDLQRQANFDFSTFEPPETCEPSTCPNIHCPSRREQQRGKPCIYSKTQTNRRK